MLSALLNSIQSSLGTGRFLVSAVFPVALFAMVNGLLALRVWPGIGEWIDKLDTSDKTFVGAAGLGAVLVASYLLSALASAILETFEGRHWPVTWFRGPLYHLQLERLRELEARYNACKVGLGEVKTGLQGSPAPMPAVPGWVTRLNDARTLGQTAHPRKCTYPATARQRLAWRYHQWREHAGYADVGLKEMAAVRRRREAGKEIAAHVLNAAVNKLVPTLQDNDADGSLQASPASRALDGDCEYLIRALYFSRDRYLAERIRLYNLRRFRFPVNANATERESTITLAPTALGNVARTMRSYAQSRYGFDLDVLWTRLQNALRSSETYFANLQDAKVQLDFFAACAWLTWLSTFAWLGVELFARHSVRGFLIAGIAGPVLAHSLYVLACRAYGVFADVMRTGVDLFRFKVLSDLHLPLPPGLDEERDRWLNLANAMGYENTRGAGGSTVSFTYKHGA